MSKVEIAWASIFMCLLLLIPTVKAVRVCWDAPGPPPIERTVTLEILRLKKHLCPLGGQMCEIQLQVYMTVCYPSHGKTDCETQIVPLPNEYLSIFQIKDSPAQTIIPREHAIGPPKKNQYGWWTWEKRRISYISFIHKECTPAVPANVEINVLEIEPEPWIDYLYGFFGGLIAGALIPTSGGGYLIVGAVLGVGVTEILKKVTEFGGEDLGTLSFKNLSVDYVYNKFNDNYFVRIRVATEELKDDGQCDGHGEGEKKHTFVEEKHIFPKNAKEAKDHFDDLSKRYAKLIEELDKVSRGNKSSRYEEIKTLVNELTVLVFHQAIDVELKEAEEAGLTDVIDKVGPYLELGHKAEEEKNITALIENYGAAYMILVSAVHPADNPEGLSLYFELKPYVETYNQKIGEVPNFLKMLFRNARINVYIDDKETLGIITKNDKITKFVQGEIENPTMKMYTDPETIYKVMEDPSFALEALNEGKIRYKGVGITNQVKVIIISFGIKIFNWFKGFF